MKPSSYTVSELWIYPIKSLGGIQVTRAKVLEKGLEFDRRFMLADASGAAITQRSHPVLALFRVQIDGNELEVQFKSESLRIPLVPQPQNGAAKASVWDDTVSAFPVSKDADSWFSSLIGEPCTLLFFPESQPRPVDPAFQINGEHVSLADAFPVLIIGQQSLNDVNNRLAQPVPMNRFRPNIVFTGGDSFDEDNWAHFSIGPAQFAAVKPCARCVLTTVDQSTGVKGTEPLRTLATYRTRNNKVYFGQNVLVLSGAEIKTGDELKVKSYR